MDIFWMTVSCILLILALGGAAVFAILGGMMMSAVDEDEDTFR